MILEIILQIVMHMKVTSLLVIIRVIGGQLEVGKQLLLMVKSLLLVILVVLKLMLLLLVMIQRIKVLMEQLILVPLLMAPMLLQQWMVL